MTPRKRQKASSPDIPARTTMYKGIKMRSRLEADFAGFLDRAGADWKYEPVCFAGPEGQWLPDFRATLPSGMRTYFEVKPDSFPDDKIDPLLEQMTVAWLTDPTAVLQLVLWKWSDTLACFSIMGFPHEDEDDDDLIWWFVEGDGPLRPYPGMNQFKIFVERAARERETAGESS